LRERHAALIVALGLALAWVYGGVVAGLAAQWRHDENYSHGFLVVPFAAYVAWTRRDALRRAPSSSTLGGLALLAISPLILTAGKLGAELFLTRLSLIGVLAGSIAFIWGRAHLRVLAFPVACLLFAVPLPAIIFNELTFPLQLIASTIGESVIQAVGIPVLREGNVLQLANRTLEVAEACSGIRSLSSLMMFAVVLGHFSQQRVAARVLLALSGHSRCDCGERDASGGNGHRVGVDQPCRRRRLSPHVLGHGNVRDRVARIDGGAARRRQGCGTHQPTVLCREQIVIVRAALVIAMLTVTRLYTASADREVRVPRQRLAAMPLQIGPWDGRDAPPFADDVLKQLGADEYVNRNYVSHAGVPVALYVGYYASQRQGDAIHSPRNCLPGAGWQPIETGMFRMHADERDVAVNRAVVQKGLDREVVLYWYQGRGRIIADEYANKFWLMLDAARLHRTDGGLVRLISPVSTDTVRATEDAAAFGAALLPYLSRYLP
jgi:EpsI family protein